VEGRAEQRRLQVTQEVVAQSLDLERHAQGFGEGEHLIVIAVAGAQKSPNAERSRKLCSNQFDTLLQTACSFGFGPLSNRR
jgi:hypothetical protein